MMGKPSVGQLVVLTLWLAMGRGVTSGTGDQPTTDAAKGHYGVPHSLESTPSSHRPLPGISPRNTGVDPNGHATSRTDDQKLVNVGPHITVPMTTSSHAVDLTDTVDDMLSHLSFSNSGNLFINAAEVSVKRIMSFLIPSQLFNILSSVSSVPSNTSQREGLEKYMKRLLLEYEKSRGAGMPSAWGRPTADTTDWTRQRATRGIRPIPDAEDHEKMALLPDNGRLRTSGSRRLGNQGGVGQRSMLLSDQGGAGHRSRREAGGREGISRCLLDLATGRLALLNGRDWGRGMADSSAHMGSGLLDHEMDLVGVRGQCQAVRVPPHYEFQTQYCVGTFAFIELDFPTVLLSLPVTAMSAGVCFPDTCSKDDVRWVFTRMMGQTSTSVRGLKVKDVFCSQGQTTAYSAWSAAMVTVAALWFTLVLGASLLHACCGPHPQAKVADPNRQGQGRGRGQRSPSRRVRIQPADRSEPANHHPPPPPPPPPVTSEHVETDIDADPSVACQDPERAHAQSLLRPPPDRRGGGGGGGGKGRGRIRGILRMTHSLSLLRSAASPPRFDLPNVRALVSVLSLPRNAQRLLLHPDDSSPPAPHVAADIGCVHGLRVLSVAWAILVSASVHHALYVRNAFSLFQQWRQASWQYALLGNGCLSLDSLLAASGLLAGYAYGGEGGVRGGRLRWLALVGRRYWRVAPTLVAVGAAFLALFPHLTHGPLSVPAVPGGEACPRWGWLSLGLVHNLAPAVCLQWTWPLAVDFQLFLVSVPVLRLLQSRPRVAYAAVAVVVAAGGATSGVLSHLHSLPVSHLLLPDPSNITASFAHADDFASFYLHKPWAHAGAFLPALMVGHLLRRSDRRASLRVRTVLGGWLVAGALMMAALFSTRRQLVGEGILGQGWADLFNATHRTLWAAAVNWLVLACATGYGGPVNSVLAHPGWRPLSRVSVLAYVVSPMVSLVHNACLPAPPFLTDGGVLVHFLGVLVISFALAFLLTLTLHMPLIALPAWVKAACRPCRKKSEEQL